MTYNIPMKENFIRLFKQLDQQLTEQAAEIRLQGSPAPRLPFTIHIVGQMALLLSNLTIPIASTIDVDAIYPNDYWLTTHLRDALSTEGLLLESDHHLIWMPTDTTYQPFFEGDALDIRVAYPLFVMASKCKFKRVRDRQLLAHYFAAYPESRTTIENMGIDIKWVEK